MILAEQKIYPFLEMETNTEYRDSVERIFEDIRDISLCWLAEEELEMRYPDHRINKDLVFKRQRDAIVIMEDKTQKSIAQIRFSKD